MIRNRVIQTIKYGHFRDAVLALSALDKLCQEKGLSRSTFWSPLAGTNNELIIENEYANLTDFERESAAFYADAEVMDMWRSIASHVIEGTGRSELIETAPVLA